MSEFEYDSIQKHLGSFPSFLKVDVFDLKNQKLVPTPQMDEQTVAKYREILMELNQYNLDALFRLRISIYNHHIADLSNVAKILKLNHLSPSELKSSDYLCYYMLNSLDFVIYYKATTDDLSNRKVSLFHQLKEYLFLTEDYRDQLEFFIEMRREYVVDPEINHLQNLLLNEYESIVTYVKGLYNIYQCALKHYDTIAMKADSQA